MTPERAKIGIDDFYDCQTRDFDSYKLAEYVAQEIREAVAESQQKHDDAIEHLSFTLLPQKIEEARKVAFREWLEEGLIRHGHGCSAEFNDPCKEDVYRCRCGLDELRKELG